MKDKQPRKVEDFLETHHFKIMLLEDFLGTVPKNKEIYASHIQSKAKDFITDDEKEKELETNEEVEEKGWTGFHKDDDGIFIFSYMCKGFIKSAADTLMEIGMIKKVVAYKKRIDNMIFINPRKLRFKNDEGNIISEPDDVLERPLRIMTRQGPRVTVSRSDLIKAGRLIEFDIAMFPSSKSFTWSDIVEILDYGKYVGLGQWRASGGYGKFEVVELDI